jgi:hypothetical protein
MRRLQGVQPAKSWVLLEGFRMRAVQVLVPLKQEGGCGCVPCPAGPGMFTGAALKGYGGLSAILRLIKSYSK